MQMKATDKLVARNVWVSSQIYFSSKRRIGTSLTKGEYRARLNANAKLLSIALEEFRKYLKFDKSVSVRLASLKSYRIKGLMDGINNVATIRYRTNFKNMLETLAHELVHAEQFKSGKLKYVWDDTKWAALWCGEKYKITSSSLPAYVDMPWEDEAFKRQEGLAAFVYIDILKRLDELTDTEREVLQ